VVIGPEFGIGASTLLEQHGITAASVKACTEVRKAIRNSLTELQTRKLAT
jgi:hypothetical protein